MIVKWNDSPLFHYEYLIFSSTNSSTLITVLENLVCSKLQ